tara:strand:+ start:668 stop:1261 length:594 start_codon:yes stop_codon:yes gene_type:complete
MAISKKVKNSIKDWHILTILGLVILGFVLCQYSSKKNTFFSNYQGSSWGEVTPANIRNTNNMITQNQKPTPVVKQPPQPPKPSLPSPSDGLMDKLNGPSSISSSTQPIQHKSVTDPSQLLPSDSNNTWANSVPPNNELKNINLLSAGQHIGINTVGSSLRNPNLQLRAEPANPVNPNLCPWNMSTIEPDIGNGIKVC